MQGYSDRNNIFANTIRRFWQRPCRVSRVAAVWAVLALACAASATDPGLPPAMDPSAFGPEIPQSYFGGGGFFSQDLGTLLRLRYNTASYGQDEEGNLDIGTMQVVNFEDAAAFFDGQVTLNDIHGVGYNLGLGFRWLDFVPFVTEPERITGVSLWADGMRTQAGGFFPQIGVTYESLGDMWDLRVNGYLPVGQRTQVGEFETTGEIGFFGNSIGDLTQAKSYTAFDAAEVELARRLGAERDAWGFAGGYVLNSGDDDTAGYRLGLRGYAYPDLMLQIAISDDDIFKTNAAFSIIWFVGRTRSDYQPTCSLPDRFREPVLRNDYVILSRELLNSGIAFNDPNGEELRVVHVASDAPPGGDGTYEMPLNNIDDVMANSMEGDIVFLHSGSTFTNESVVLQDDQQLYGEGDDVTIGIATQNNGTITLPESSPGARSGPKPIILDALGDAVTAADNIQIVNLTIDGGTRGIVAAAPGDGTLSISDLLITNTTGSAMSFSDITGDITIDNVMVTEGTDFAMEFNNVDMDSAVTVTNFEYDGGAGAAGGLSADNFDGTFNISTSSFTGGTLAAVSLGSAGDPSDGTFTFANDVTYEDIGATVFDVDGLSGNLTVNSGFESDAGYAVSLANLSDGSQVVFLDDISSMDQGIQIIDSEEAIVQFQGDLTLMTGMNDAVTLQTNTDDTDINFNGALDIETTGGQGFFADSGGQLTASNTNNTVTTTTGTAVSISDSDISVLGVNFGQFNVTAAGASNAALLENNTGGPIVLGDLDQDQGTIAATTGSAIVINNSANVTVNNLEINNPAAAGVSVVKAPDEEMTVNLSELVINGANIGVDVSGSGGDTADLTMTVNDTNINSPTAIGMQFDDIDSGTVQVNNTTVDGNNVTSTAGIRVADSDADFTFDEDTVVEEVNGAAFEVNGGEGTVSMSGIITNSAGDSIYVHNISDGSVTFLGEVTDTGSGVLVENNTGGEINFLSTMTLMTDTDEAVFLTGNTGATVDFNGQLAITTTSGDGFTATGGGTVNVSGSTNTISTQAGTGLIIQDMTIGGSGVAFQSVSVDGADHGIHLEDNDGGTVTVGETGNDPGDGGTLANTDAAAVLISNANATLNGVDIMNANTGSGDAAVELTKSTNPNMTVALNDVTIDTDLGGVKVDGTAGSGTFNVSSTGGTIEADDAALEVSGRVSNVSFSQEITNTTGQSINVHDLTAGNVAHAGDLTDSGEGISVADNTGGNISLLGDYTLTTGGNDAVVLSNNTGTSIGFDNLDITTTGAAQGFMATGGGTLSVFNSGGANSISTQTGTGLEITDMTIGGLGVNFDSVSVNGADHGIVLTNLTGSTVTVGDSSGSSGDGGTLDTADEAIQLTNVSSVALNNINIEDGGGGDTDGIVITNDNGASMTVTMNNVDVSSSTSDAVEVSATGSGTFNLTMNDSDFTNISGDAFNMDASGSANDVNVTIDSLTAVDDVVVDTANNAAVDLRLSNSSVEANTAITVDSSGNFDLGVQNSVFDSTGSGGVAFTLTFDTNAEDGDVIIEDNDGTNGFYANNASAFVMTASGTNVDVDFELDNNVFDNSSASATADIQVDGGATLDATVVNNESTNGGAGREFYMLSDGSNTRINLDLNNNGPGGTNYELETANQGVPTVDFNFGVVDRDDTDANNPANVIFTPAINQFEDIGSVQTPVLPP